MILVDTGAWFATYVPSDANARAAIEWTAANEDELVTTDYIVDDVLTLLRSRGHSRLAVEAGEDLWCGRYAKIEYLTRDDLSQAWHIFRTYDDKRWSFTDCTSFALSQRLQLTGAFAFDEHFRQFGGGDCRSLNNAQWRHFLPVVS